MSRVSWTEFGNSFLEKTRTQGLVLRCSIHEILISSIFMCSIWAWCFLLGNVCLLKRSSSPSASLFKIWQIFRDYEKNNREELEQSEHSIRKEIFWTFSRKKNFEKMAIFIGFWLCWDIAKTQLKIWILCLMFAISVPSVCMYGVRLHVYLTLLSMEMSFHTQILKNSAYNAL